MSAPTWTDQDDIGWSVREDGFVLYYTRTNTWRATFADGRPFRRYTSGQVWWWRSLDGAKRTVDQQVPLGRRK